MSDYDEFLTRNARLVILKELSTQPDGRLNDALLQKVLDVFGHKRSREWVRTQLRKLQEIGGITLSEAGEAGSVMVAKLTRAGADHVEQRSFLDGVDRPSIGG